MDRRIVKTHKAIREAYFQLIKERDTTKISISDIARKANIDRKTFYLHYDSVDAVLDEYIEELINEMHAELNSGKYQGDPFNVENVLNVMADTQQKELAFLALISKSDSYDGLWHKSQDAIVARGVEIYKDKTNMPEEQLFLYIEFFVAGILDIYRRWLRGDYQVSFDEMTRIVTDVAYNGIETIRPK